MPLKNRRIPLASKLVFEKVIPNYMLVKELKNPNLKYKPNPEFIKRMELNLKPELPSGYEKPIGMTEKLPFFVKRTPFGSLPVYIDYKKGRTLTLTQVRNILGDVTELQKELITLTEKEVMERVGRLELKGNHLRLILLYLRSLGF